MMLLPREDPADALIFRKDEIKSQPRIIDASSPLRRSQLSGRYPEACFVNLGGDLASRLEALASGQCDALTVAMAELKRLRLPEDPRFDCQRLAPDEVCPAAGQGLIAFEIRRDNPLAKRLEPLIWASAQKAMDAERKLQQLIAVDRFDVAGAYVLV